MWIQSILYLTAMAVNVLSETCPLSKEIMPCFCNNDTDTDEIAVQCIDEEETMTLKELGTAFESLIGKKNVKISLELINLKAVPSDFFQGIRVVKLDIYTCDLDSLAEDENQPILVGLEDTIEELSIVSSLKDDDDLTTLKLGHLRKLKKLDVVSNHIPELSNKWFDTGPASLEQIFLYNNVIKKLGERAFANLINLKELSIIYNRFGHIERNMLPTSAKKLITLNLNNNGLRSLPEDIFSNMSALRAVSLVSNDITRLDQDTWEPVWEQLENINLEGNPLLCDSHMNWTFSHSVAPSISGSCVTTKEVQGGSLKDFIEGGMNQTSIARGTSPLPETVDVSGASPVFRNCSSCLQYLLCIIMIMLLGKRCYICS